MSGDACSSRYWTSSSRASCSIAHVANVCRKRWACTLVMPGPLREPPEHLLQAFRLQRNAMAELTVLLGRREERSGFCAAESQVLL